MTEPTKTPATTANETITLVVPAAGCGARAALNGNKILAPLAGQPLLFHTLRGLVFPTQYGRIRPYSFISQVVIAARRDEFAAIEKVWNALRDSQRDPAIPVPEFLLIEGGNTRQDSVENAARAASSPYLAVHDAARPLASRALLERVWQAARISGAAIPALSASDTTKLAQISNGVAVVAQTLARDAVWLVQTPQVFRREILLEAFEHARATGFVGTDCASAVEQLRDKNGAPRFAVRIVEGETHNFKVTFAADLERVQRWLEAQNEA